MLPEPAEQTPSRLPPERQQRRYNGQGRRRHGNIGNDFLGNEENPICKKTIRLPFPAADPFILCAADGRYYLYCTSEDGSGFPIYTSEDLQLWERCGTALGKETPLGRGCFWAPECYEIDGIYYLFYSADWKVNPTGALENFRIGVARASTPSAPFTDISDHPIFDPGYPIIDANVFAEDGRYYLYYSRCCYEHKVDGLEESWIYGVELAPDFPV